MIILMDLYDILRILSIASWTGVLNLFRAVDPLSKQFYKNCSVLKMPVDVLSLFTIILIHKWYIFYWYFLLKISFPEVESK